MSTLLLWQDTVTKASEGRKDLFLLIVQEYILSWPHSQGKAWSAHSQEIDRNECMLVLSSQTIPQWRLK